MEGVDKINSFKIEIENPAGTYKSFQTEGDPIWGSYPLKGVTYPVDYGYVYGYRGEDGAGLDIFVGSGKLNGFIKIWRLDVPEETKFFKDLSEGELAKVLETFGPVLVSHQVISDPDNFIEQIERFKE